MISSDVEYWIECIDLYELDKKVRGRSVLVWGAYSKGGYISEALVAKNLDMGGYIDGHKDGSEYLGKPVFKPEKVLDSKKYYVVVAIEGVRKEIKNYLNNSNYIKDEDYFYFAEHVPDVTISSLMGEYRDQYNNCFVYQGEGRIDVNIHFTGGNNHITIDSNFSGKRGLQINAAYGTEISLGKGFISRGEVLIDASMGGVIHIGNNYNVMTNANINAKYKAVIEIGDYVTSGERFFLSSGSRSGVYIGNDCMISHDVSILGTNGHSIIDDEKKENRTLKSEKPIRIGNHVWLGKGCSLLYGTDIGDGSIVGTGSMAKGIYPSNCIIAGNIAKVIREECTWDRRREIEFEEL